MARHLTRRDFLKLLTTTATVAVLAPAWHARAHYPGMHATDRRSDVWMLMGRSIHTVTFYREPSTDSERLETRQRDQQFRILEEARAPFSAHNDLWYKTPLGYVHSAWVLPVRVYAPQPFIADIGAWGFWGEVSQIYTEAYTQPSLNAGRAYRFYGGTVYHVVEALLDEQGLGWYRVADDYPPGTSRSQWVLAKDVRRVPPAEMSPIHPFVDQKRIEVDLSKQVLTCFEGDTPVFVTQVASGLGANSTPTGERHVLLKQASRHMANLPYPGMAEEDQPAASDIFDLPGVPWNTFFDLEGRAIHGAYWHNDYGIPRSHGCLNTPTESARWVYRWTQPLGGVADDFIQSDHRVGTPVIFY